MKNLRSIYHWGIQAISKYLLGESRQEWGVYTFFSDLYDCTLYAPILGAESSLMAERFILDFLDVKEGEIGIDIGASFGRFTLPTASKSNKGLVIAIEPEPLNYACLALNVKSLKLSNVILFNAAVADKRGLVELTVTNDCLCHYLSTETPDVKYYNKVAIVQKIEVPSVTLADIVSIVNPGKIDWIKIDTEGSERRIVLEKETLRMLQEYKPRMSIEMHKRKDDEVVIETLKGLGYNVRQAFPDPDKSHNFLFCEI